MVAIDEQSAIKQPVRDVVAEDKILDLQTVAPEQCLMRDSAQGNNHLQRWHGGQLGLEMPIALANFGRRRFIGRRQAANGVGNTAIAQQHGRIGPLIRPQRFGGAGKAKAVQRGIKQFTGDVAGEWPAGTIRTFLAGAKADDEQFGVERAESGNGQGMPVRVTLANGRQVFGQARAGGAVLGVVKCRHGGDVSMSPMQLHWDIFCRVIDNYGDIGVCWRLARQLASEHGKHVRLWLDDLNSLQPLYPALDPALARQYCSAVEIIHWTENPRIDRVGEIVIEAFACELPTAYLETMARTTPKPCWINLEYLTAEAWAESCHGMASPHTSLPLTKYFYFPGFSETTGGLLREQGLFAERNKASALVTRHAGLDISLFSYDTAPISELIETLAESPVEIRLHVAPGQPLAAVTAHLGGNGPWQHGRLRVLPFAFLPQDDYDRLLWRCDINFVRGEDSFVRAQWAGKPFVWQIYRQAEDAHLVKLEAFLDRYTAGLSTVSATAVRRLFRAWNSAGDLRPAWADFIAVRLELDQYNHRWANKLAENENLAEILVKFCAAKV